MSKELQEGKGENPQHLMQACKSQILCHGVCFITSLPKFLAFRILLKKMTLPESSQLFFVVTIFKLSIEYVTSKSQYSTMAHATFISEIKLKVKVKT